MVEKKITTKEIKKTKESYDFKGKYLAITGKRKSASAQIRLYEKGTGIIIVNGEKAASYFTVAQNDLINQPIKLMEVNYDFSITVKGGGKQGQAEAVQNGIAKGLLKINEEWRTSLKAKGWLTRDSRKKERKKPGLKKARKAPQWSKR